MSPPRSLLRTFTLLLMLGLLAACSSLRGHDPLRVELVGLRPLPGQELEVRFELSLRLQNPNQQALTFKGVAIDLDLNGQPLLSGVSDQAGEVPAFGERLVRVPVSLGAFAMARQLWAVAQPSGNQGLPYRLQAKLGGGWLGSRRFSDEGVLRWPPTGLNDLP